MHDCLANTSDKRLACGTALLWLAVCASCSPTSAPLEESPAPRPLGEFQLLGEPSPCDGELCYEFEVQCPEVAEPERGLLKVGGSEDKNRGVVLLTTGGLGTTQFGANPERAPARLVDALHAAGLRTAKLSWENGWSVGSRQGTEGFVRLACRPATVAAWVKQNLVESGEDFCAAGGSGGAAQTSYMLTHYGLEDSIDLAVPWTGYWMGRVDEGCLGGDPLNGAMHYGARARANVDLSFGFEGFPGPSNGPCSSRDESWREAFEQASVSLGGDYYYPNTMVWLVLGGGDTVGALRQGLTYYDSLLQAGSPDVRMDIIPNAPHGLRTPEGEAMLQDILIRECRPSNAD